MRSLLSYRHVVEPELKEFFIKCLRKSIKGFDMSNIGFIGVIDSKKEMSHDIDVLIFPSEKARIGETLISIMNFYKRVETHLKKKSPRFYISTAPKKVIQEMVYYLSGLEEGDAGLIPVHSLFFTNYPAFKRLNPINFQKKIKSDLVTIYGDFNIIKRLPVLPERILEIYYLIIEFEMMNRIKNFPRHLIRASAESLFNYIEFKNRILTNFDISINKNLHSIPAIEKEFLRILRELDNKVYADRN